MQQKAAEAKKIINISWKKSLNQRRQHKYQQLRNENTSAFYCEWIETGSFIPRKFRPKIIPKEPQNQMNIRINLAKQKMKTEAELCVLRAKKHVEKLERIDATMIAEISTLYEGALAEELKEMYRQDCKLCDAKSATDGHKQAMWLQNLPSSYEASPKDLRLNPMTSSEYPECGDGPLVTNKNRLNGRPLGNNRTPSMAIQVQQHRKGSLQYKSYQDTRKQWLVAPDAKIKATKTMPYKPNKRDRERSDTTEGNNTSGDNISRKATLCNRQ